MTKLIPRSIDEQLNDLSTRLERFVIALDRKLDPRSPVESVEREVDRLAKSTDRLSVWDGLSIKRFIQYAATCHVAKPKTEKGLRQIVEVIITKNLARTSDVFVELAIKVVTIAALTMVVGGYADAWWHVSVGREEFWILPHLIIYSSFVTIILAFSYIFFKGNLGILRWTALTGLLMMLSAAPIDNWWHETHPPEIGLGLMSPPHIYFAIGGAVAGVSMMRIVAEKSRINIALRQYFFVYIFAGYLMTMQAIGLLDPSTPTVLGDLGSGLFAAVPAGFYIFTRRTFASDYVMILGLGEGLAKSLLEGSLLYLGSIISAGLFVALFFRNTKGSYFSSFSYGAFVGFIMGSYLFFFVGGLSPTTILLRYTSGVLAASLAGIFAYLLSNELIRSYDWKRINSA